MANVSKAKKPNSDGTVSYYIKVFMGEENGRQTVKNLVWRAPAGMSDATALKKAEAQAAVWERDLLAGMAALDGKTSLDKFLAKHDLPHVTPHTLRHTFATLQIASGVDLRTLQARTGHAQASTLLNIYSHALKSAQKDASEALADVLLGDDIG